MMNYTVLEVCSNNLAFLRLCLGIYHHFILLCIWHELFKICQSVGTFHSRDYPLLTAQELGIAG